MALVYNLFSVYFVYICVVSAYFIYLSKKKKEKKEKTKSMFGCIYLFGDARFYRRFNIKVFSKISHPLCALLSKKA